MVFLPATDFKHPILPTVKPQIIKQQLLICAYGNTGDIRKGREQHRHVLYRCWGHNE
jgi:hypothetical protein